MPKLLPINLKAANQKKTVLCGNCNKRKRTLINAWSPTQKDTKKKPVFPKDPSIQTLRILDIKESQKNVQLAKEKDAKSA